MAKNANDIAGIPPVKISEHLWVYGGRQALSVVQEERSPNGDYVRTTITEVPWSAIDKARASNPQVKKSK